jgi:ubiquinone/menaquinone biosynthesis C-methylase UbiE
MIRRIGRRFARFVTDVVVRRPALWPLFRRLIRLQFDQIAPTWDVGRNPNHLAAFERALEQVEPPARALDLGTGTGEGAFAIARRFPQAEVVGVDLAEKMLAEARRKTPAELEPRVRFETADAERLPYSNESFELVTLANMIPFFDELARLTAPGGAVVFSFSAGAETPIYVPFERLRGELERRGFSDFADFAADGPTALLARKTGRN